MVEIMTMKSSLVCCCLLFQSAVGHAQNSGHDPGVPELAVLNQFLGNWSGTIPNSDESINASRAWILNGRFLKHDFALSSGNLSGVIYRGYDQKNSRYTLTIFDSTGSVSLLAGDWSKELKTFSFDAIDSSCAVQKYESYFPDDHTEHWRLVMKENMAEVNGIAKKSN